MQITREADYAIRCVLHLSRCKEGSATVGDIAEAQSIPRTFAAKILQKLSKAKIVKSVRGIKGGFRLARDPARISILDVIEAIQGPLNVNICVLDRQSCERQPTCMVHPIWVEIQILLKERLAYYTFDKFNDKKGSL